MRSWPRRLPCADKRPSSVRRRTGNGKGSPGPHAELGHRDRRAISALAGLAPLACGTGAMHGRRCIWGGRKRVRDALYMAALAACRCGPFKAVSTAMREKGKPAKLVVIAVARRLLATLKAAIRDNKAFQP
ncbi:transposase [Rhizobium sp. YS-1r]|uniref:transposase n=1 Tax=Rhizobium sp. YS-1r TaxID=1532558 RepID=UPI001FCBF230|nr:transposase [Rhizobium sp. YS-1r]